MDMPGVGSTFHFERELGDNLDPLSKHIKQPSILESFVELLE